MKFLIIGLGNIGLRHIQGLSKLSDDNLEFYIFSKTNNFETKLKKKIDIFKKNCKFQDVKNLADLKDIIFDLTIISTTATDRIKILLDLVNKVNTKYIMIEKPISQSEYELQDLKKLKYKNIFVNFPRRYCNWHKKIKDKLNGNNINKIHRIEILGSKLGLACNTCHFIDLVVFFTIKKPTKVLSNKLSNWYKSKRNNFYDVDGVLEVEFEDKISLKINSMEKKRNLEIKFYDNESNEILFIDYVKGEAKFLDGEIIKGELKYQSESSHKMFRLIQKNDKDLCKLDDAIEPHELLIKEFIKHWNNKFKTNNQKIMIT